MTNYSNDYDAKNVYYSIAYTYYDYIHMTIYIFLMRIESIVYLLPSLLTKCNDLTVAPTL